MNITHAVRASVAAAALLALVALAGFLLSAMSVGEFEGKLAWAVVAMIAGLAVASVLMAWRWFRLRAAAPQASDALGLRQGLMQALAVIKQSRLGRAQRTAALYELPWYLVLGARGAGKSSIIRQAEFSFPLGRDARESASGTGGSCNWLFSTEAVFLDTCGFDTVEPGPRAEWRGFWRLLRRSRPREPLNGVLLAISLAELLDGDQERRRSHALQMRACLDEMADGLGMRPPVYLLVTKLDLLDGFGSFFRGSDDPFLPRILGVSLALAAEEGLTLRLEKSFAGLCQELRRLRDGKLTDGAAPAAQQAAFGFPVEFEAVTAPLSDYVRLLCQPNPYHLDPRLRGVYFSSAIPAGRPVPRVAREVSDRFGLELHPLAEPTGTSRVCVSLRAIFDQVILPDRHFLAALPARLQGWRIAAMIASLAITCLCVAGLTRSYLGNRVLLDELAAVGAAAVPPDEAPLTERFERLLRLQARLEQLDRLREGRPWRLGLGLYQGDRVTGGLRDHYFFQLRTLMLDPVGVALGNTLRAAGRSALSRESGRQGLPSSSRQRDRVGDSSLPIIPLGGVLADAEDRIVATVPDRRTAGKTAEKASVAERDYQALKTYLMLGNRARMEDAHLSDQLPRHWRGWLEEHRGRASMQEIAQPAQALVAFYVAQRATPDIPVIDNDPQLVARVRQSLRAGLGELPAHERAYRALRAGASARFEPVSLARLLGSRSAAPLVANETVPGLYTREAYENFVRTAVAADAGATVVAGEDWVLDGPVGNQGTEAATVFDREALEALYRRDYEDAWLRFLSSIRVEERANLDEAIDVLGRLADGEHSPLPPLLQAVAAQFDGFPRDVASQGDASVATVVLQRASRLVRGQEATSPASPKPGQESRPFARLRALVDQGGEPSPQLAAYLAHLVALRGQLRTIANSSAAAESAGRLVKATLEGGGSEFSATLLHVEGSVLDLADPASKAVLRPLLVGPLNQAFSALLPLAEQNINLAWQREVLPQWRNLADKYPFSDVPNEALHADIAAFVRVGGVLDQFVAQRLDGYVSRRGNQLLPRTWGGQGLQLHPGFVAGAERLFAFGASFPREGDGGRYELQPEPTPGLSEIVLEIDGQKLRYRNGAQTWQAFVWPGASGSEGALVRTVDFAGAASVAASHPGRMGLVRLLAGARTGSRDGGVTQLEWQARNGEAVVPVRLNFRMVSGASPVQLAGLRGLALPERIVR